MMNTETSKNNTSENSAACVSGFSHCKETIKKISPGVRHRTRTYEKKSDRRERLRESSCAVMNCQQSIKKIFCVCCRWTRTLVFSLSIELLIVVFYVLAKKF